MCGEKAPRRVVRERLARMESRHAAEVRSNSPFPTLKVLGHGHVFEVWILISSGSDIIIQIRTRGFGDWPTVGRAVHRAGRQGTIYRSWDTLGTVAAVRSLLQEFVHISLAAEAS